MMRHLRSASFTTLAILFALVGCAGSSNPPRDAWVDRSGGGVDSGAVGDVGAVDSGASSQDSGAGDMVVIESGVPDSAADISIPPEVGPDIPPEVGPDAAFDLSPSEPLAAPDAPSDPSPGAEKANPDVANSDMACAAGYQYGGNGTCVAIGSQGADSGSDRDGTYGQDDTGTGPDDGAVDAEPADVAAQDLVQAPDSPADVPAAGGADDATGGTGGTTSVGGSAGGATGGTGGTTSVGGSTGGTITGGVSSSGGVSTGGVSTGTGGSTGPSLGGNPPLAPTDLNIADRVTPLNVEGTPLFGWVPNDPDGNEIQSAYQIQVTRVADGLAI